MTNKQLSVVILPIEEFHNTIFDAVKRALVIDNEKQPSLESCSIELLSTDQLAVKLQVSNQTIDRWRKRNKIPFVKIGKSYRYDLPIVLQELAKRKGGGFEK